jgi:hypothetical protein
MSFLLRSLPTGTRLAITGFLAILSLGYLFMMVSFYVSHAKADGKSGLSREDLVRTYYKMEEQSLLEAKITTGSMKDFVPDELARGQLVTWVRNGADEKTFTKQIEPIIRDNCQGCHNPDGVMSQFPFLSFKDVKKMTTITREKSINTLLQASYTQAVLLAVMFFFLCVLFSMTGAPTWLKAITMPLPFLGILLEVGGWWVTRWTPSGAFGLIWGVFLLALSFVLLNLGIFAECWVLKGGAQITGDQLRSRN